MNDSTAATRETGDDRCPVTDWTCTVCSWICARQWMQQQKVPQQIGEPLKRETSVAHEHDAAGCLDCQCAAMPWSSRTPCTCSSGSRPRLGVARSTSGRARDIDDFKDLTFEYGVTYVLAPHQLHRGPMTEQAARDWLAEAATEVDYDKNTFQLVRRLVGPWRPA